MLASCRWNVHTRATTPVFALRMEGEVPSTEMRTRLIASPNVPEKLAVVTAQRLLAMQAPTACVVIAGIEAVQMIRKGQVLGITKKNLYGQAWVFGALLGVH